MRPGPQSCSAVFLVRVWLEDELLRARITDSRDLLDGDETVVVSSAEGIEQRLHDWLQELTAAKPVRAGNAASFTIPRDDPHPACS